MIDRNASGRKEIVYGDLFLSIIDTGTHVSSFEILTMEARIQAQSLKM